MFYSSDCSNCIFEVWKNRVINMRRIFDFKRIVFQEVKLKPEIDTVIFEINLPDEGE